MSHLNQTSPISGSGSTMRLAGRLAGYRRGLFAATVTLLVASEGLLLLIGWLLRRVFDELSGAAPAGLGVRELIAVLVAVEAVRLAVRWAGVIWTACMEQMAALLRLNLLRAQMSSGGPEAGGPPGSPGAAVSHFRDDTADFLGFSDTAAWVAGKAAFTIGAVSIMISIDPVVTMVVLLPMVAMAVAARVTSGRIAAHRRSYRQSTAAVTGLLGDLFGAVLAVQAAGAGRGVRERLAALGERRRRAALRDQLFTDLLDAFNRTTVDLSVGLVLLLAIPLMRRGDFTVGDLALFVSYAAMMVELPRHGGRLLTRHRQAGVAAERMATLLPPGSEAALVTRRPLHLSGRVPHAAPPLQHVPTEEFRYMHVRGLTAVHPYSGRGVHDLDLTIERGTLTVITGPVGAGKTTLLRALLGLLPASRGTVYWNGDLIGDPAAFLVPPRSAYVPQTPRLFGEPLRDNLLTGRDEDESDLATAIHTAVLEEDVAGMPGGLTTWIGPRGVRLSGGQVQRAALARALVRRPALLVLDDVSSALDVRTERQLWDRLLTGDRTSRPAALLVVSNRPATIARADQVITLDHGRLRPDMRRIEPVR